MGTSELLAALCKACPVIETHVTYENEQLAAGEAIETVPISEALTTNPTPFRSSSHGTT
jgi:hypothetical protein